MAKAKVIGVVEPGSKQVSPEVKKPWELPPDPALLQAESEDDEDEDDDEEEYENVRVMWTRSYVAGLCIRQFGLKKGVTDEMIEWANARHGKPNDSQSYGALVSAWHVVRGYSGEIPSEEPEPETPDDIKESIKDLEEALAEEKARLKAKLEEAQKEIAE